jgi:hypothetical protein
VTRYICRHVSKSIPAGKLIKGLSGWTLKHRAVGPPECDSLLTRHLRPDGQGQRMGLKQITETREILFHQ